jgi:tyrosyl-tRNA synthetase
MIENNGIKIDDNVISDIQYEITNKESGSILRIGKKRIFKIIIKD